MDEKKKISFRSCKGEINRPRPGGGRAVDSLRRLGGSNRLERHRLGVVVFKHHRGVGSAFLAFGLDTQKMIR